MVFYHSSRRATDISEVTEESLSLTSIFLIISTYDAFLPSLSICSHGYKGSLQECRQYIGVETQMSQGGALQVSLLS